VFSQSTSRMERQTLREAWETYVRDRVALSSSGQPPWLRYAVPRCPAAYLSGWLPGVWGLCGDPPRGYLISRKLLIA
jgi:hypothetical protein